MKTLIMTALLVVGFSSNLMAQSDKTCYPLSANQDGFNRICIEVENPRSKDTNVEIELYRFEKMVERVAGTRSYVPQARVCMPNDPTKCYRQHEGLKIISESAVMNVEVFMRLSKPSTCLNGDVSIVEQNRIINLQLGCVDPRWQ